MPPDPYFSVIIPTRNREGMLRRCLSALAEQSIEASAAEIIVVDDGSTGEPAAEIGSSAGAFPVSVLRQSRGGPGSARNSGAAVARGLYLAFAEDDVVPDARWLESARVHLDETGADILEGRTVDAGTGKDIRSFEPSPRASFIPCNLFVRRSLFERVGGYDPGFFDAATGLYFREDSDFGFRAIGTGARIRIARDVSVEHPSQFSDLASCLRHARRYIFDPLLCRKHPLLYRRMIEVKTLAGIPVHRPQHYASIAYLAAVAWTVVAALQGSWEDVAGGGIVALMLSTAIRYKYRGGRAFMLYRIGETAGFLALPLVYLAALAKGSVRYRSYGALY